MGFFSWNAQDTNRSIANSYSKRKVRTVTMTDNKGHKWTESAYEGYGVFGGKDYYELLAEMNGLTGREAGLSLAYSGDMYIAPNLNEDSSIAWKNAEPVRCGFQGYFY